MPLPLFYLINLIMSLRSLQTFLLPKLIFLLYYLLHHKQLRDLHLIQLFFLILRLPLLLFQQLLISVAIISVRVLMRLGLFSLHLRQPIHFSKQDLFLSHYLFKFSFVFLILHVLHLQLKRANLLLLFDFSLKFQLFLIILIMLLLSLLQETKLSDD